MTGAPEDRDVHDDDWEKLDGVDSSQIQPLAHRYGFGMGSGSCSKAREWILLCEQTPALGSSLLILLLMRAKSK